MLFHRRCAEVQIDLGRLHAKAQLKNRVSASGFGRERARASCRASSPGKSPRYFTTTRTRSRFWIRAYGAVASPLR